MSRRFAPGVPDVVFALVLISVLIGGRFRLLNDPGTLWHYRLGQEILRAKSVPRTDTLTFTHAGEPWVDQSWLFDAGLAWLVNLGGWSTAALVSALGIATIYGGLAGALMRPGRSPIVALSVAVLAAGVGTIHFLIRPHLFTLGFVLITSRVCRRQHESGGRSIYLIPALVVVWANLHGGFLAGPLIVGTSAIGNAISGPWDAPRRRNLRAFVAAGLLCLLAGLVNPYGLQLYQHVGRLLLTSGVTDLIEEYQPVPFGRPDARAFELVLLAFVALPTFSSTRLNRYDLLQTLTWLHLGLSSVRNAPLFALAAAPGLAQSLDGLPFLTHVDDAEAASLARWSIWPGVAGSCLALAVVLGTPLGGFDPTYWPLSALPRLNHTPTDDRLFHEQDWGGLIEAEAKPRRLAFIDDRFEIHGKAEVLRYLNAIEGGPDWDLLNDHHAFRLVWLRPGRGLARRLRNDRRWREIHHDPVSVLFERQDTNAPPTKVVLENEFDFPGDSLNPETRGETRHTSEPSSRSIPTADARPATHRDTP